MMALPISQMQSQCVWHGMLKHVHVCQTHVTTCFFEVYYFWGGGDTPVHISIPELEV